MYQKNTKMYEFFKNLTKAGDLTITSVWIFKYNTTNIDVFSTSKCSLSFYCPRLVLCFCWSTSPDHDPLATISHLLSCQICYSAFCTSADMTHSAYMMVLWLLHSIKFCCALGPTNSDFTWGFADDDSCQATMPWWGASNFEGSEELKAHIQRSISFYLCKLLLARIYKGASFFKTVTPHSRGLLAHSILWFVSKVLKKCNCAT